jgi:hypothetical protein
MCSKVVHDVFSILNACRERMLWCFAVISVKDENVRAGCDQGTELAVAAERRENESRTV